MLLGVADVFATSLDDLVVPASGEEFEIDTGDAVPIKQKPFRMASGVNISRTKQTFSFFPNLVLCANSRVLAK